MRNGRIGLACALAFLAGCLIGLRQPVGQASDRLVDLALVSAGAGLVGAWVCRRGRVLPMGLVLSSLALLGFAHADHALQRESPHTLVDRVDDQPELVRFEAELLEAFAPPDSAETDLLDRFQPDADDPPWRARADLTCLDGHDGRRLAAGRVTLVAPAGDDALEAGDTVRGIGWLAGVQAPRNPGERDLRGFAWRSGTVGRLRMDTPPRRTVGAPWWMRARRAAQHAIDDDLLAALRPHGDARVQSLVVAMTTGRRLPGYASLRACFASTGLSHFLAISGFNVAVLFATCGALMELARVPGRARGPVLVVMGALFLLLVDVEVSVLRAGVAGMLAGVSLSLGRGWRADGTLAFAALLTLAIDPWAATNAGFLLSYGAVLALRHGSRPVDASIAHALRWLRCPPRLIDAAPARAVRIAFAASLAAWLVSTPITLACLGTASPWCAVASTMLGPLAAVITVLASIATVAGCVPGVAWMIGLPLAWLARCFLWLVEWVGTWPGCSVRVDAIDGMSALLCLVLLFVAWVGPWRRSIRVTCVALSVCVPLIAVHAAWRGGAREADEPRRDPHALTWTTLAIGDGSVHLIEAGGIAVLFDAGSVSRQGVGSGVVVPALRALGVRRLQAILVSHPHLDHFAAVPEVIEAFPTERIVLTDPWRGADSRPGATAVLLDFLRAHDVPVQFAHEGWRMRQGPVEWVALHPPPGFRTAAVNDGSLAFLLRHDDVPDRPAALLLGDAQDAAIARHLQRRDLLRPWVMELPHHGGWRPLAQTLCEWVHPRFVMQSTGQRRFARDRLSRSLADAVRGVTCRDGALRFSLVPAQPEAQARLERWTTSGWRATVP